jgi:adenylosuccinate lyase
MNLTALTAVSPVDGRYHDKTNSLSAYFSEWALIKYRVRVEIEYFILLVNRKIKGLELFPIAKRSDLIAIYKNFSIEDGTRIKEIEKTTNHDVKAVEYFIKEKFDKLGLSDFKEFIHFGLTSQDINNTSTPLLYKEALNDVYLPLLNEVTDALSSLKKEWKDIPMLARTHGQPASPTRLDKEIQVFIERIEKQIELLKQVPYSAKFGGATGNFNAHHIAYPEVDWVKFGNEFVNEILGLNRSQTTTQIEHYDNIAASFDALKRINTIFIDLCRDFWTYISMEYFKQKIKKGEVGSSAMPHKINPIDFENAEGNLGLANAILEHLAAKLPVSRLQRDLTDSTVLRNIGVPVAHMLIALQSIKKGLGKLLINKEAIEADLDNNWAVVAEAIQTILRKENYPNPYEALKDLTRNNQKITHDSLKNFIDTLEVSDELKDKLKTITPFNYTGI